MSFTYKTNLRSDFLTSLALKFYFLISYLRLVFLYSQNHHGFIYAIISSTYCTFEHNKFHIVTSRGKEKVVVQDLVSGKQLCRAGSGCVYLSPQRSGQTSELDNTRSLPHWAASWRQCTGPALRRLRRSSLHPEQSKRGKTFRKCLRQNPPFIFLCSRNDLDKFSIRGRNFTSWPPLFLNR